LSYVEHSAIGPTRRADTAIVRFYGYTENAREVDMDMKEMVEKVKKGEPLYGKTDLTPYMQGVAARNSRYSALLAHIIPWANFTNHNQVSPRSSEVKEVLMEV
jgi:C-terminal of NADH-ubiquinone oxidoreductase 21 kDa subunit